MNFDIKQVPFSCKGSYLAFSLMSEIFGAGKKGLYLRTVHGDAAEREIFLFELEDKGISVPFDIYATPWVLHLESAHGYVDICFARPELLRIRGAGIGLRMTSSKESMFNNAIFSGKNRWSLNLFNNRIQFMLTPLKGRLNVEAPWDGVKCDYITIEMYPDNDEGYFECAIEEYRGSWQECNYNDKFEDCVERVKKDFEDFLSKMPEAHDRYQQARELAAYINWSCIVEPHGLLKRPAMFMSKNWMTNVWSWDHCFNAIALSYKYPELAWHQYMVMFDLQDENGALPDSVNDSLAVWNFCKPPVHGWTLKKMMENTDFIDEYKLKEIYEPLCNWTDWWFRFRDDDNDGIPQYNHGNDSGWDNSTIFVKRPPIESPDLSALLVIQMEVLSDVARILGKSKESNEWKSRAIDLLERFLAHFIEGDRLVARCSGTHEVVESQSLLPYISIILGKKLPENVLNRLISELKEDGSFITPYGFATENIKSPYYESDGYWRGPIWAPSTMLLIDGLKASGEEDYAKEVSRRFVDMASKSGFAENYDALTGEGLRDRAYTWTSSVFLILAHEIFA
ncbi:Glycosyl hydrolase family 63 C-terminal domain-containing protein [Caldanaerobius fijiensis DSM 17918]|uniref:Glycosyl hydrolase family 63 C-terminal domain-containing protein n=1 Tax=Caldanaerobius fijiensis DSM 17918 TaxID=1121256 RepID=A0A1M5D5L7_9THEO|nr:trehalase family glycosidase [Caldanaerobius fijiensis]SHF62286.1 Glycosyl hydrolase family 63 C-terminal domain-containing protein [Caldanaerobius fijiensis DSM 17918]